MYFSEVRRRSRKRDFKVGRGGDLANATQRKEGGERDEGGRKLNVSQIFPHEDDEDKKSREESEKHSAGGYKYLEIQKGKV